jgi:hypothetical protein
MQVRLASADFSAPIRGSGPRTVTQPVIFPRAVRDHHHLASPPIRAVARQGGQVSEAVDVELIQPNRT